ncbi:unnamed protein product [Musa hybrid cultivar]
MIQCLRKECFRMKPGFSMITVGAKTKAQGCNGSAASGNYWSCRVSPPRGRLLLAATAVVAGEMNGPDHVFDPIRPLHALTNWPPAAPILPYPLVHTVTERVRRFQTRPTSRLRRRRRS